jgi:hypothetical protein
VTTLQLKLGTHPRLPVTVSGEMYTNLVEPRIYQRLTRPSPNPINQLIYPMSISNNTIPRPSQVPLLPDEQHVPLLPLRLPTGPLRYPALPCPPRHHRFTSSYTLTTHIIPAAFPRSSPFVPLPAVPAHESKDERAARIQRFTDKLLSLQAQHVPDQSGTQQTVLWNVLNRYVRKSIGGTRGLTLLMLHANGLHKEVSVKARAVLPTH